MTPTAQSMDMSSSTDTAPPSQSSTALLFSMAPPKTRPLTRTSSVDASATDEDEEQRKRVLQLKRRFLKNPSVSSKFFAKRETRKKIAREVSMYKSGVNDKAVTMVDTFRMLYDVRKQLGAAMLSCIDSTEKGNYLIYRSRMLS